MDWKDPKTHREPKWPVGGFAPGQYMSRCLTCKEQFLGMDKRAFQCFPCAVDGLTTAVTELRTKLTTSETENRTLRAAFQILTPPTE